MVWHHYLGTTYHYRSHVLYSRIRGKDRPFLLNSLDGNESTLSQQNNATSPAYRLDTTILAGNIAALPDCAPPEQFSGCVHFQAKL